jgi:hypothetical protein
MKEIMTITLTPTRPVRIDNDRYTVGQEATIFLNEADGTFGYRYQGVNYRGEYYQSKYFSGFETKQAATKDALESYNIGTGC